MNAVMKVLLDTNVILDVLLRRGEWLAEAEQIWQANQGGQLEAFMTASSLTDIYYISRRIAGGPSARQVVRECLDCLQILAVDAVTLEQAFALVVSDYEDAVQMASAARNGLDAIITRDPTGFAGSSVPALTPGELIRQLSAPRTTNGIE